MTGTRHLSVASQETNASGLAESTMTFGTVTEDSIQLSQFPVPPSGVPLSPCHSPSRSHFNATTPPATPTLRYGTPIRGLPLPPTTPLVLQRKPLPSGSQGQGLVSSGHDSSRVGRPANGYANSPSPPPLLSRTQDTVRTRGGSPPPPPYLTSPASRALSPHDWHEGASSIDVDATEDRLLSTSFITSLLSSTETASERSVPYSSSYRAMGSGQNRMSLSAFSGMSASSEVTYPIPTPAYQRYPPQATSTNRQPTRAESRRPPPSAYTRVEEDDWLTAASNRTSGDSVTLSPPGDIDPVIRTANISRAGVRGASIVGVVQGKLHGMTDVKPHQSLSSSNGGIARGSVDLNNNIHAEKLGVADYYVGSSSVLYSPAAPSTSTQNCFIRDNTDIRNEKHHSSRSYVPSLISAIKSLWAKPLPPVPKRFTGLESERAEAEIPLPELVNRAEILSHMLDRGYYPHRSLNSAFVTVADREVQGPELERKVTESTVVPGVMSASAGKPISHSISLWPFPRDRSPQRRGGTPLGSSVAYIPKGKTKNLSPKKKTFIVISACASIAVIVGITVGLTVKHPTTKAPVCSGNFTGSTCSLNATCVCTSSPSGQCNGLAQNLISLIPTVNNLFHTNYTANSLSNWIWQAQGALIGNNCAAQSVLVDVAPALDSVKWPNRTEWAQSALLWNLVQSQDLTAIAKMRSFVVKAPWGKLGDADGPVPDTLSAFSIASTGFVFDYAAQTVSQPNATFLDNGQPTSAQIAKVGSTARSALDRMYSYALASSTQRQDVLTSYWRSVLQQNPADLAVFMSVISSSPILVPFDATSSQVAGLLTTSNTAPFPPPLACYPGLDSTQIQRVNMIETSVFGLPPVSAATQFNASCFADRPLYGVLDVLRLRLPFVDSRTGVAKQAAVLTRDVGPRVVVYSGEILSAFPGASATPNTTTTAQTDPRQYGTLRNLNHVILNYMSSIPDIKVATALVEFVLSSPTVPPANTTILFQSLASIPVLEVGIFGTISPSDISSSLSSLTTPSGSLFFGSDQGSLLRNWTITGTGTSVAWAEFASSAKVVRDDSYTNVIFNQVWDAVSTFLHTSNSGYNVGVGNITQAFQSTNGFSP